MTHDLWTALNGKILEYLSGVSLAELVANQLNKQNNQPVQFTLKRENAQLRA
jgi:Rrf2 family iron-sulfur cluster assembly transcriptional regulator